MLKLVFNIRVKQIGLKNGLNIGVKIGAKFGTGNMKITFKQNNLGDQIFNKTPYVI